MAARSNSCGRRNAPEPRALEAVMVLKRAKRVSTCCAAIEDALRPLGVRIDALPVTPAPRRALIREAKARKRAAQS